MRVGFSALAIAVAVLGLGARAEAVEFSKSSTTGKSAWLLPVRAETPRLGHVSLDAGVRFAPVLSDLLGPANLHSGLTELSSSLFDASANLYWHFPVAEFEFGGRYVPTIAPYLGARYLGIPTTELNASLSNAAAVVSYSQLAGVNYGVRAEAPLPLGFHAFALAGLTTLLSGGWDSRENGLDVTRSGRFSPRNATLPSLSVGAGWNFYDVLALNVGYELFTLPTGMRAQSGPLAGGQTTVNTLSLGARLLFVSI